MLVTRAQICDQLISWQAGWRTTREILDWASHHYIPGDVEFDDCIDDDRSAAKEVLAAFDSLDMNLMFLEMFPYIWRF